MSGERKPVEKLKNIRKKKMDYKYHAIVLGKKDVGETDRIYTLYTREAGKLRLTAAGAKKPMAKLAGNLETLTYSEIFAARNRGRGRVTGAIAVESFLHLKEDINSLERVFYALGIFDRVITQEERDEEIFAILLGYLQSAERNSLVRAGDTEKLEILTSGFIFKLLEKTGYALEMRRCVRCQGRLESERNFFSAERGGVVCPHCSGYERRRVAISGETIKFVRLFTQNKMESLEKINAGNCNLGNLKLVAIEAVRWITA